MLTFSNADASDIEAMTAPGAVGHVPKDASGDLLSALRAAIHNAVELPAT